MDRSRRDFLFRSGCGLTMAALASQTEYFGLLSALAQKAESKYQASPPSDYRALVCIYLTGGNDGNNTVIPVHNDSSVSGYSAYSAARAPQGLALPQKSLLPIAVPRIGGLAYGLHSAFGTAPGGVNSGLHPLWAEQKMAIVTNVGTLTRPITRAEYHADPGGVAPRNLFSHTDQTAQHQTGRSDIMVLSGWGGRISDRMTIPANPDRLIPTIGSTSGPRLFTVGESTQPLSFGPAPTPLSRILALTGYDGTPVATARLNALEAQLDIEQTHDIVRASNEVHREAIRISRSLTDNFEVTAPFPTSDIGNQLKQIARLIKARGTMGLNRQIFFCTLDGFDTHTGQLPSQQILLGQLSQASRAFYDEMNAQGLGDKVTQFTMTDFNRTFNPGGSGTNVGSDHAWANHQFVIGGAVNGGDFFGMNTSNGTPFPTLVENGPDDADNGGGSRGRWIPTTSVEQYAGTISKWFGLEAADVPYVFPNIANFPIPDLGFMLPG